MTTVNCPSCGASISFAIGSSEVVVCAFCRSIVARTDRGVESHGKVAALVDTNSPLARGVTGSFRGVGFRITGRSQLRHQAGGVWDEWYAALDDGRWAWIAEAQGRFYATFRVAADAPARDELQLGGPALDGLVVAEIGTATLISAEGELPWTPDAGSTYEYADLTSGDRRFATIDYSEDPPIVFKGLETTLQELGIRGVPARSSRVGAVALNCPSCGGALELRAPDQTERVWCPYCGAGSDVQAGKLAFFKKLQHARVQPVLPLGSTGTFEDGAYVIAGYMERAVHFDRDYFWSEYLLFNPENGFRWLVHSDDHWSFVTPLRPGEVIDSNPAGATPSVRYGGASYRLFQSATARVTYVLGEFYWKVAAGDRADTVDWVNPPFGLSKEITLDGAKEIAYSHARYLDPKAIEKAFGVKRLPRPAGVGPMQPYGGLNLLGPWLLMLALLLVVSMGLAIVLPGRTVATQSIMFDAEPPVPDGPPNARITFSQPFELSGSYNVEVKAHAGLENSWISMDGDLVNDATGATYSVEMPLEFYSGVDGGERWTEGSRERTEHLSRPEKGRYTLRLESQWEPGKPPPIVNIEIREGVFRITYFVVALLAISILPLISIASRFNFELERWKDSSNSPFGSSSDDEEE